MQEPQQEPVVEPQVTPAPEPEPQTPEPIEPAQEPQEPQTKEPQEPAKEPAGFMSEEELDALLRGDGDDEPVQTTAPPVLPQQPAPQVQQEPSPVQEPATAPQIPAEVMAIKPQNFMPQGQAFDDMDANTYGTPSFEAWELAGLARQQKMSELTVRQGEQNRQRNEAQDAYNQFVQTHPDMKNPMNQSELHAYYMQGGVVDGVQMTHEEHWAALRFVKNVYRPAKVRGGNGKVPRKLAPAPLTSMPRATEPQGPGDAQGWGDNTFGPED